MNLRNLFLLDKILLTKLYRMNVQKSDFVTKFIRLDFLVLVISLSIILLPWPLILLIYIIVLTPYLRLTIMKTQRLLKWRKKIKECYFIFLNNNDYDQSARERYFKELFSIIMRYMIFSVCIFFFLYNKYPFFPQFYTIELRNSIELYTMIYLVSVPLFCSLSLKAISLFKQLFVLFLTNPVILLFLFFLLLGQIPVQNPQDIFFFGSGPLGSFLLIFTQAGIDKKFILQCLIYAIIHQVLFSVIQPAYRVEKGKLAVEIIAFTFGAISIIGLFFSTEISSMLHNYVERTAYLGNGYFKTIGITTPQDFKLFFENTFKYILLPSSFCSTMPLIIFKFREYSNKNKGNKLFEKSITMTASQEKSKNLKKAIYFGGSSIKNLIMTSPYFHNERPYYISKKYKKTKQLMRSYRRIKKKIVTRSSDKIVSFKVLYRNCKSKIFELKSSIKEIANIISINWRHKKITICISIALVCIINFTMYYLLLKLNSKENLDNLYSIIVSLLILIYTKYVELFSNNHELANYSFLIIYYGLCSLYFAVKKMKGKKAPIAAGNTLKAVVNLIIFLTLLLTVFLNIYILISPIILCFTIFHFLWFLNHFYNPSLKRSQQKDESKLNKTQNENG